MYVSIIIIDVYGAFPANIKGNAVKNTDVSQLVYEL